MDSRLLRGLKGCPAPLNSMALQKNDAPATTSLAIPKQLFLFYKSVFKIGFFGPGIQRFGNVPADAGQPPGDDAVKI